MQGDIRVLWRCLDWYSGVFFYIIVGVHSIPTSIWTFFVFEVIWNSPSICKSRSIERSDDDLHIWSKIDCSSPHLFHGADTCECVFPLPRQILLRLFHHLLHLHLLVDKVLVKVSEQCFGHSVCQLNQYICQCCLPPGPSSSSCRWPPPPPHSSSPLFVNDSPVFDYPLFCCCARCSRDFRFPCDCRSEH